MRKPPRLPIEELAPYLLPESPAALPPNVSHLGNLTREALFDRYARADVLVFPTLTDGFGMVATEAMANGLPVLTTTAAGAADLIRHEENGLVIPAGDEDALARSLVWCVENRERLRRMRSAAAATAAGRPWAVYRAELIRALAPLLRTR